MSNDPNGVFVIVALAVWFVIFGIPLMQIIHRTGYSRAWVLIMFVPLINVIFLWIYAFRRWPVEGE